MRHPLSLLLLLLLTHVSGDSLYDALAQLQFLHEGIVHANDSFTYFTVPCSYLEPENVTVAPAQGIGWTEGGACPLLWNTNNSGTNPNATCNAQPPHSGYDREGGDYTAFPSPGGVNACQADCCNDATCVAWAYTPTAPPGQVPCAEGTPCCYLKSTVNPENPNPNVTSGIMNRPPIVRFPPVIGMRSAVPLGGVGAGAAELRADGTFHEVTIVNQSPAGAAKFGVLADAWLGVRAGGTARLLRTSPPSFAVNSGVSSLTYSGIYPVTKLTPSVDDFPMPLSLYAYSKLVPGDLVASTPPAIMFTVAATNPSVSTPMNLSLIFAMPLASVNDCARLSSTTPPLANITNVSTSAACLHACAANTACLSWTWIGNTCLLAADVPLSVHYLGAYCGLAGSWSSFSSSLSSSSSAFATVGGLTLTLPCAETNASAACGDTSVVPILSSSNNYTADSSYGVADDPSDLWASFATNGRIDTRTPGIRAAGTNQGNVNFFNTVASIGAATVNIVVPPGANATVSLVWTWYFPHRDHAGEDIGNFYSTLWTSSMDVAQTIANGESTDTINPSEEEGEGLVTIVTNLVQHHRVFIGPSSSLPDWLTDMMVNQMSHFRGMIASSSGKFREFEAFDCMDLDSIHNDYQRHLPYIWLMPEFEIGKLRKWASGQVLPQGYIQEFLGPFGVGPFDVPGGRIMGDTTTLWIVELYELWRNMGDVSLLTDLWPVAVHALNWTITNSAEIGLPWKLYSTYDILWLDGYNTTSYNAFLYMTALKAGAELAIVVNDNATGTLIANALARAETAVQNLLWDNTGGYFRAYSWGTDAAVMADALYGQVIATGLGLGWLVPPSQIASHLNAEMIHNANPYGFRTVTGRVTPPPGGQVPNDDANWQQAGPDWSALAIALIPTNTSPTGTNITAALDPAQRSLNNWRLRINSLWNIAGITSTDTPTDPSIRGLPTVTSHYGFQLVSYWLLPLLAGQNVNIPGGTLTFNPVYACPFQLPLLLAGTTGTLACQNSSFTVTIAFGNLVLPAGGLMINDRAYPLPVNLGPGESVNW